ncbi:MAG: DUF4112 domain-containing protein [Bacteroides sp.]|nr:DUF4112 domain-containing protein [Bacteroides sp.]
MDVEGGKQQKKENLTNHDTRCRGLSEEERGLIKQSAVYRIAFVIAKFMDRYLVDPVVGLLFPVVGDFITSIFIIPFIYISLFRIRSLPLTLAIIFNTLRDIAIGLIPFWIGAVCDFFNRSNIQNMKLIIGFVEGNQKIIDEVNRKAVWMGVLIVVCCILICLLLLLVGKIFEVFGYGLGWLSGFVNYHPI